MRVFAASVCREGVAESEGRVRYSAVCAISSGVLGLGSVGTPKCARECERCATVVVAKNKGGA